LTTRGTLSLLDVDTPPIGHYPIQLTPPTPPAVWNEPPSTDWTVPPPLPPPGQPEFVESEVPWRLGDIVLSLLVGVIGGLVLGALAMLAAGADLDHPRTVDIGVFSTVAYAWIILSFWFFILKRRNVSARTLFARRLSIGRLALLLPIAFGAFLVSGTIIQLVINVGGIDPPQQQLLGEGEHINGLNWLILIWTACVCAPVAEEFVFRGVLFGYFRKRWAWLPAALIPAALFALSHVTPYVWPAFFVLGVILAAVREWTKTLLAPMLVHALYNGLVLLALYAITETSFG
jgi:membrane protease YdiL (CAAX protease family)